MAYAVSYLSQSERIINGSFVDYELKQRMHHTAEVLHHFMPALKKIRRLYYLFGI
ncbi:hypothetical protein AKG98_1196 [Moritella sp. JT01]|nr:hypothetical protein AKG98_1196 [Moritella sp. JT01]